MKRGEIWWADLEPPAGRRPVLLLSRDEAYTVRSLVVVAPVTTRIRGIPSEVPLGPENGLAKPCVADLDVITTISRASLTDRVTNLNSKKLKEVEDAIHFSLGMK